MYVYFLLLYYKQSFFFFKVLYFKIVYGFYFMYYFDVQDNMEREKILLKLILFLFYLNYFINVGISYDFYYLIILCV